MSIVEALKIIGPGDIREKRVLTRFRRFVVQMLFVSAALDRVVNFANGRNITYRDLINHKV